MEKTSTAPRTITPNIEKDVKEFLHKTLSPRKPNTVFSLAVIATVLLTAALQGHTVTDTTNNAKRPSSDTAFYRLETTLQRLEREFRHFVEKFLHKHWRGLQRELPYLLVDETHESYTGKKYAGKKGRKKNPWIHAYRPKKGDTGSFKFLVFSLVGPTKKLVVRAVPLKRKEKPLPHIVETICWLRRHARFKLVMFDRGFYDGKLVHALKSLGVKYLIRARISKEIRCMLDATSGWTALEYPLGANPGKPGIQTTLVLGRDKRGPWAFATNACPRQAWRLRHYYRERWNIENTFKVCDGVWLPTNSTRIEIKLLFFLFSCVVYNVWQHARHTLKGCTLRQCARLVRRALVAMILEKKHVKPPPVLMEILALVGV